MADHDLPPPTHSAEDDVPRGGPWVRYISISFALILAMIFVPQSWKLPLAALSIFTLVVGVGMLMKGRDRG
jgi:hypothetical protein